jgi:Coenzyme PQQ synthesis protein D (PqqD)
MPVQSIVPHPDVVDTQLDGDETVLLHLGTKRYFSLNATGSVVWRALKDRLTEDEMSRELQRQYDVSADRASRSVSALLQALVEQRLVSRADQQQPPSIADGAFT